MWPAATCLSSLAAAVLLVLLVMRTGPEANRVQRSKLAGTNRLLPPSLMSPLESPVETHSGVAQSHRSRRRRRRRPSPWRRNQLSPAALLCAGLWNRRAPRAGSASKFGIRPQADQEPATVKDLLIQTLKSRSEG